MAAQPTDPLGRLELEVLRYVADHPPASVRQVAMHFAASSGQARTTLLTVMERLRAKGYLSRRKIDRRYHYTSTIPTAKLLYQIVGDFVDDALGGAVSPFVAYLARSSIINRDEARKLQQLLKKIESRERGERHD